MKIIKYLFFLLLLCVIGMTVYIATLDGDFKVEESQVIDAPDTLVFATLNEYKTWEKWGPWMDDADDIVVKYSDTTSGEGAYYTWRSPTQGAGKIETQKVVPYTSIQQKITFVTPAGESTSDVYWTIEKLDRKKTKVTWGIQGSQSFMEKAFWLTQDNTLSQNLSAMYKEGLQKLATYVQKEMEQYTVHVDGVTEHGGGFYMYSAMAAAIPAIPTKVKGLFPAVQAYMQNNNIPQAGELFVIYNEMNTEQGTAIFSAAIPTTEKISTPIESNVLCKFLPRQHVLKATLKGNHKNLEEAWKVAYQYCKTHHLIPSTSGAFEVYRIQETTKANPAAWVTELYIPLEREPSE